MTNRWVNKYRKMNKWTKLKMRWVNKLTIRAKCNKKWNSKCKNKWKKAWPKKCKIKFPMGRWPRK